MRKIVPLGMWPLILLFGLILPIEVKSEVNGRAVSVYVSDFRSTDHFDSPNCKPEGALCKARQCCHMFTCRWSGLLPRCKRMKLNVWFPSSLMKKIRYLPCLKEGQDCEDDICCSGLDCYSLSGSPDFKKRCMISSKILPPPPPPTCKKEGEDCKTGQCCPGKVCQTHDYGAKKCKTEGASEPTTVPIERLTAQTTKPTAPVVQPTTPPNQQPNCLGEGVHCQPGQCCLNMICHTFSRVEARRICKRVTFEGIWLSRVFYTHEID